MYTKPDLASEFASRLRAAADTPMAKLAKAMGTKAEPPAEFVQVVGQIIGELDGLTFVETGGRLSEDELREICSLVDDQLGLQRESFWMVKKGSVRSLIEYQRLVMQLLTNITYG